MASTTTTKSLSYIGKDATDIRKELINLVPEITDKWKDFNESDLGTTLIELIAAGQDYQNFYFDIQAFETFLDTAQQDKNIRSLLRAMNYRVPFAGSAKGEVYITLKEPLENNIIVPKYTQLMCSETGIKYATYDDVAVEAGKKIFKLPVIEGEVQTKAITKKILKSKLTTSGEVSRRIYLGSETVADKSVWIDQDRHVWEECDDALLKYEGGRYYSVHKDSYDNAYILMSVDFLDLMPADENEIVVIKYLSTQGLAGVVDKGAIDTLSDFRVIGAHQAEKIENKARTYGAYDIPDLTDLKILARRQAQNMDRYITLEDFENGVATEPYVMRYIVKDWKSKEYVQEPYKVRIWAVDWSGNNLGNLDIETLKNKFKDKASCTVEVEYMFTKRVPIDINVHLNLKTSTEANATKIRDLVREDLEQYFQSDNLEFGQSISLNKLESRILALSNYIRSVIIESPERDIVLDEVEFPEIASVTVTSQ